jgi:hypothetical protein
MKDLGFLNLEITQYDERGTKTENEAICIRCF